MIQYHNYTITELDNLYPFELDIYSMKLKEFIKAQNR